MKQAFRFNHAPSALLQRAAHRCEGDRTWMVSEAGREYLLQRGRRSLRRSVERGWAVPLDAVGTAELSARLFVDTMSSRFSDQLPDDVRTEALVRLAADPKRRLEYVGRGGAIRYDADTSATQTIDIPGGRRHYHFRSLASYESSPELSVGFREDMATLAGWINDPDAKTVLSIGGGGYRAFAVTPVLRLLDLVLKDRSDIDEVWGCSGGAVAGHVFAEGFDPGALDQLGYSIHHQHDLGLPDFSVPSVAKLWLGAQRDWRNTPTIQRFWLDQLEAIQPESERRATRIPFYAVSANPSRRRLYALTDPHTALADDMEFVLGTERSKALAATAAVPMIFPTQRGIASDEEHDVWVDGGLLDENPVALPFAKWSRERARGESREKLKILLVDLNARTSESKVASALTRLPVVGKLGFKRMFRQLDMLLDSRSHLTLEMVSEMPEVQVYRARLSINAFAVRDRASVIPAILGGRDYRSWELALIGRGSKVQLR